MCLFFFAELCRSVSFTIVETGDSNHFHNASRCLTLLQSPFCFSIDHLLEMRIAGHLIICMNAPSRRIFLQNLQNLQEWPKQSLLTSVIENSVRFFGRNQFSALQFRSENCHHKRGRKLPTDHEALGPLPRPCEPGRKNTHPVVGASKEVQANVDCLESVMGRVQTMRTRAFVCVKYSSDSLQN